MKFLCVQCDAAMRLVGTAGPDEGSLTVIFACPTCRQRVAMLTNPWETQLVRTLGVKVGGRTGEPVPFEGVRGALARQRETAFVDEARTEAATAQISEGAPGCPFAAMIPGLGGAVAAEGPTWTPEAEARIERIPAFVRAMARQAIARFAQERGYSAVTEEVMDEARNVMGV